MKPVRNGSPASDLRGVGCHPVDEEWHTATEDRDSWLHLTPRKSEESSDHRKRSLVLPVQPAPCHSISRCADGTSGNASDVSRDAQDSMPQQHRYARRFHHMCLRLLHGIPIATWAVVLGIMFSLVQPLKALLTETSGWTGSRMPNAPDGNPPLSFILQTTTYLGAVTVPMALVVLGSSFARLEVSGASRERLTS